MATDFGNQSWLLYVVMAYGVTLVALAVFGIWSAVARRAALRALGDEGFLPQNKGERS